MARATVALFGKLVLSFSSPSQYFSVPSTVIFLPQPVFLSPKYCHFPPPASISQSQVLSFSSPSQYFSVPSTVIFLPQPVASVPPTTSLAGAATAWCPPGGATATSIARITATSATVPATRRPGASCAPALVSACPATWGATTSPTVPMLLMKWIAVSGESVSLYSIFFFLTMKRMKRIICYTLPLYRRGQHEGGRLLENVLTLIYCIFIACAVLAHGPSNRS